MAHRAFIFKSGTHLAWIGLFYSLTMLGLALKYRESAQRWLDQRFFRTEYDEAH